MIKGLLIAETQRLSLREFTPGDALFIVQLLNSPGWMQYIGDRHIKSERDAVKYLESGPMKSYKTQHFGLWKVELKSSGEAIGMCGLIKRETLPSPDIGFAFLPRFCGFGYALESAQACITFAEEKGMADLCAITMPTNKNSIRLLEKIGMCFQKEIIMPPDDELLHLYTRR